MKDGAELAAVRAPRNPQRRVRAAGRGAVRRPLRARHRVAHGRAHPRRWCDDAASRRPWCSGFGRLSARAAGRPPIDVGETVVVDAGCRVNGYPSDCTRTFVTGPLPRRLQEAYDVVLRAQLASLEAVVPGAEGRAVDRVARSIIEQAVRRSRSATASVTVSARGARGAVATPEMGKAPTGLRQRRHRRARRLPPRSRRHPHRGPRHRHRRRPGEPTFTKERVTVGLPKSTDARLGAPWPRSSPRASSGTACTRVDGDVWRIVEFQHVKRLGRRRLRPYEGEEPRLGSVVDKTFRAGEVHPCSRR